MKPFADLLEKLAGPAAEEIGFTLQDSVRVYRAKRQIKLLQKVVEATRTTGFHPRQVPLKILLPILENASVEGDEDLHSAWAALLTNASNPLIGDDVLPAFVDILKQLSKAEAVFLTALHDHVDSALESHFNKPKRDGSWPELVSLGGHSLALQRYAELGLTRKSGSVLNNYSANKNNPTTDVMEDYRRFNTHLGNLIRLGLPAEKDESGSKIYYMTRVGYEFVSACRQK